MESEYEVRFTMNHKMWANFYRNHMFMWKPFLVFFWTIVLLEVVLIFWGESLGEDWRELMFWMSCTTLWSIYPEVQAQRILRQSWKINDGVVPEIRIAFGDTIEIVDGMTRTSIEYRKLVGVKHLKHSYVLMLGRRNGIMLDPDGFTKGTFEDFKAFLHEKRPDLRIPK